MRRSCSPGRTGSDRLNSIIRCLPAQTLSELNRWMASENDVYHYDYFDARTEHFTRLTAITSTSPRGG